ncbi:MAG: hypothetical protein DIU78_011625 [Pseudomonadota bacterium]|nr:MAG: hypothetical protein DIU78_05940 [Pseudomonadota bacterium]
MNPGFAAAALVRELGEHPKLAALASTVRTAALDAWLARHGRHGATARFSLPSVPPSVPPGTAAAAPLTRDDADTSYGNVLDVLERGAELPEERAMLGALIALALRERPPLSATETAELAYELVWHAAHTQCDALAVLDLVLGPNAAPIWQGVGSVVLNPELSPPDFGRTELLIAAAALGASTSKEAARLRAEAARRTSDPAVAAVLLAGSDVGSWRDRASERPGDAPGGPSEKTTPAERTSALESARDDAEGASEKVARSEEASAIEGARDDVGVGSEEPEKVAPADRTSAQTSEPDAARADDATSETPEDATPAIAAHALEGLASTEAPPTEAPTDTEAPPESDAAPDSAARRGSARSASRSTPSKEGKRTRSVWKPASKIEPTGPERPPATDELTGELVSVQSPWVTVLLTVTLVIVPVVVVRALLRYVLLCRRPASLRLTPHGLELSQRTIVLGHVLRSRSTVVPLSGLVRITREVRYAGAALYAGLFALTLGTYVGTRRFLEGLRVAGGSLDLFAFAALALLLGISLDFFFSSVAHSSRGRCRVIVVPTRGRAFGVGSVDARSADALLTRVSKQVRAVAERRTPARISEPV